MTTNQVCRKNVRMAHVKDIFLSNTLFNDLQQQTRNGKKCFNLMQVPTHTYSSNTVSIKLQKHLLTSDPQFWC